MNRETIKAMRRKETISSRLAKWYKTIHQIIFYPVYLGENIARKIRRNNYNKIVWNESRANEILSYYIPRKSLWEPKNKEFHFFDNGMGWTSKRSLKKIKRKDRRFWKKFVGFWGSDMRKYLIEKFELDGFKKEIGNIGDGWTEITFILKEN